MNARPVESTVQDSVEIVAVGQAVEHCQIRIVDHNGNPVEAGQVGHVEIRGANVTTGYYARPDLDRSAHNQNDWLDTGDLGFLKRGNLYITGRVKDVIFAYGQNFYAHDLENIVCELPQIEPGRVAVSSVPDNEGGDCVAVFVLFYGNTDEFLAIDAAVRRTIGENTGIEASVVIPVSVIPKTTSGKLRRYALRQSYCDGEFAAVLAELETMRGEACGHEPGFSVMERQLLDICASSLGDVRFQPNDNFFEIGMNSLKLVEIHELLDRHFPAQLEISDIFDHPSLSKLAAFLETRKTR